ncbi:Appr-1-p processing [Moelleriella libera RCEF 2490]|uniref:Appr-1-p processing n=1 Tax=Moelleriella libera RCEF 2490 TaxID=1081109 RepID=A0A166VFR1_9HYPO|nr:Appr-1-p processing [Moelleriella libera RCEF 2490]
MAAVKTLGDIPTIAQLYLSSALHKPASSLTSFPPSPSINSKVGLIRGDITKLKVDAIVNAANGSLLGGGGVDGAIHRAAGPSLKSECRTLGGCPTGSSKATAGYELPAKHVIHTVGPIYDTHDPSQSERDLKSCYNTSLKLAAQNGYRTVAFSGISTGVYGYPSKGAAEVACKAVRKFLDHDDGSLERVIFVTFEQKDVDAYDENIPCVKAVERSDVRKRLTNI